MQFLTTVWQWFGSLDYWGWIILLSATGWVWRKLIRPLLPDHKAVRALDAVVTAVSSSDDDDDKTKEEAKEALAKLSTTVAEAANACESCGSFGGTMLNLQQARDLQTSATKAFQDDEDWNETCSFARRALFHASLVVEMAAEYKKQLAELAPTSDATASNTTAVPVLTGAENKYSPDYVDVTSEDDSSAHEEWRKLSLLTARCHAVLTAFVVRKERTFPDADTYLAMCEKCLTDAIKNADDEDWDALNSTINDGIFFVRMALKSTAAYLKAYDVSYTFPKTKWDTSDDSRDDSSGAEESMEEVAVSHAVLTQVKRAETKSAAALFHLEESDKRWKAALDKYAAQEFDDARAEAQLSNFHAELAREVQSVFESESHRLSDNMPSTAKDAIKNPKGNWLSLDDDDASNAVGDWRTFSIRAAKLEALISRCGSIFEEGAGMVKMAREYQETILSSANSDWSDVPDNVEKATSFVDTAVGVCVKFRAKRTAEAAEAASAAQAAAEAPATLQ